MAVNWQGGLQGGLGGAGTGAAAGSFFGPPGLAIGGGVGGLLGLLAGLFGGGNNNEFMRPQYTPQEQSILHYLLNSGIQGLQNPYEGFDENIGQYANNQFNQQILPSIAERFSSLGSNSLSSPQFASQVGQAAGDWRNGLGMLRQQYGQQNQQNAMSRLQQGFAPSNQQFYQNDTGGAGAGLLGALGPSIGAIGKGLKYNKLYNMTNPIP